jgi:hypothetical protein
MPKLMVGRTLTDANAADAKADMKKTLSMLKLLINW